MELVHVPRIQTLKPPAIRHTTLPPSRWVSPTDQKYSQQVPQLNNRLTRLWYTYAGGSKYITEEEQKLHDFNEKTYRGIGTVLLKERIQRGGHIAVGIGVGALLVGEVIMGLRWVLGWVERKMSEGLEVKGGMRVRRRRKHARDWGEFTGGDDLNT
jgi:hypothetical protein